MKTPKRIFLYHGGPLCWLRYMTIESLSKLNPKYEIILYTDDADLSPSWKSGEQKHIYNDYSTDWRDNLSSLSNVYIKCACSILPKYMWNYNVIHKADIIRWILLSEGGIWSDDDIIYLKPMDSVLKDAHVHMYYLPNIGQTIGLLAGTTDNLLWKDVASLALRHKSEDYQGYGVDLLRQIGANYNQIMRKYRKHNQIIHNFPYETIFVETAFADRMYESPLPSQYKSVLTSRLGLHWFGGNQYMKDQITYTPETYNEHDNLITKAINTFYRSI